jgi:hypothetical protein
MSLILVWCSPYWCLPAPVAPQDCRVNFAAGSQPIGEFVRLQCHAIRGRPQRMVRRVLRELLDTTAIHGNLHCCTWSLRHRSDCWSHLNFTWLTPPKNREQALTSSPDPESLTGSRKKDTRRVLSDYSSNLHPTTSDVLDFGIITLDIPSRCTNVLLAHTSRQTQTSTVICTPPVQSRFNPALQHAYACSTHLRRHPS